MFIFVFVSCKKNPIGPQSNIENKLDTSKKGKGVFILCEGNYGHINGSISYYNFASKSISNNVFSIVNSSPLGDIPQSMAILDSTGFILVNNSGKIEVINTSTFKSIATINGLNSPRYMLILNATKAYVSSLYGQVIYIINPTTFQITGTINTGGSSENMIFYNNKVYATNWSYGNKIFVINAQTNVIETIIPTVKEPNSLVLDKNNKLWVLCSGGFMHEERATLLRINPDNFSVEKSYPFTLSNAYPTKLCINKTKDSLFYLNSKIFKMSIQDESLPENALILNNNRCLYGLAYNGESNYLFASNTVDYIQQGWIYRITTNGIIVDSVKVDINPGEFCFN